MRAFLITLVAIIAAVITAPIYLREPIHVPGKTDGNCAEKKIDSASLAEKEANDALLGRRFHYLRHLYKNPAEAKIAFETGAIKCKSSEGGYDPFLLGKYWVIYCFDVPKKNADLY